MYHDYFGLKEPAFSIAVNPKYLYMSAQHKEALAHLIYGVQGGGFVLLSGEVGTGKTTIIRCLLEQLPENTEIAFVLNPMANVQEMLLTICEELHINVGTEHVSIKTMMDVLQKRLLENFTQGKRTVLLIDEAQLLSADVLEQIRLLTNLETSTDKLLQIVLVGQPEVNSLLSQPRLRQLSQRITARFHLQPLNLHETALYIDHRLNVAGKREGRSIFPKNIIKKIHAFSGGIPRLINIICERLLVGAYGHNKYEIDSQIYKLAVQEVEGVKTGSTTTRATKSSLLYILPTAALALSFLVVIFWVSRPNPTISEAEITPSANSVNTPQLQTEMVAQPEAQSIPLDNTIDVESSSVESSSPYLSDGFSSYERLFQYYGIESSITNHPCWQTDIHQMSCVQTELRSWQDIKDLNRPVVLSLVTEDKDMSYVVLAGFDDAQALVVDRQGKLTELSQAELGRQWTGRVSYLWRKPENFNNPLSMGATSPIVALVAEKLALLDKQHRPITGNHFTKALQTRIKIFQGNNQLQADGVIGERTLMKLDEKLGAATTLVRSLEQASQG